MAEHEHQFRETLHLDGCHFYTTSGACRCGATFTVTSERDPTYDPYSLIWMEPGMREIRRDEKGRFCKPHWEEVTCLRCDELRGGAPTRHDLIVLDKAGNVLREEHEERPQREPDPEEEEELGSEP